MRAGGASATSLAASRSIVLPKSLCGAARVRIVTTSRSSMAAVATLLDMSLKCTLPSFHCRSAGKDPSGVPQGVRTAGRIAVDAGAARTSDAGKGDLRRRTAVHVRLSLPCGFRDARFLRRRGTGCPDVRRSLLKKRGRLYPDDPPILGTALERRFGDWRIASPGYSGATKNKAGATVEIKR